MTLHSNGIGQPNRRKCDELPEGWPIFIQKNPEQWSVGRWTVVVEIEQGWMGAATALTRRGARRKAIKRAWEASRG